MTTALVGQQCSDAVVMITNNDSGDNNYPNTFLSISQTCSRLWLTGLSMATYPPMAMVARQSSDEAATRNGELTDCASYPDTNLLPSRT